MLRDEYQLANNSSRLAIALHNIPEGLAVGVAFGALAFPEFGGMELEGVFTIEQLLRLP